MWFRSAFLFLEVVGCRLILVVGDLVLDGFYRRQGPHLRVSIALLLCLLG
jgi:hypothetical protein